MLSGEILIAQDRLCKFYFNYTIETDANINSSIITGTVFCEMYSGVYSDTASRTYKALEISANERIPFYDDGEKIHYIQWSDFNPITGGLRPTSKEVKLGRKISLEYVNRLEIKHKFDGSKILTSLDNASFTYEAYRQFSDKDYFSSKSTFSGKTVGNTIELENINRAIPIINASNFTDEENATVYYQVTDAATVFNIQAALSVDGENELISYRDISTTDNSYTFEFTEAERKLLSNTITDTSIAPIYYLIKVTRTDGTQSALYRSSIEKTITIIGEKPTLNPTVKDVNSSTIALTGNENILVRYASLVEFTTGAQASKGAYIKEQSVKCGSKTISGLYNGVIDDPEESSFIFRATDSRNLQTQTAVSTTMIDYIKPTCKQDIKMGLVEETGATITLILSGNYFNGSFGLVDNSLLLEVRHTDNNGDMSEWQPVEVAPTIQNNIYTVTLTFGGLRYDELYTFQCRATDKLHFVESAQYSTRLKPVFDWGNNDFNFNVPLNMNGETVLRHNAEANNTVLSGSGGHIYLRPNGTESTYGETIIYPDGRVAFGGSVDFESFTINGSAVADYIIEQGTEPMGSNGTWYWCKWASGKAECWGCRNFGNMAVNTTWGNLYRSAVLTQDLPPDVFITTPDVININIVNSNFGGWICKHEQTAPSAITTGSFIFVRPASATVYPTYFGFHIIGLWKQ